MRMNDGPRRRLQNTAVTGDLFSASLWGPFPSRADHPGAVKLVFAARLRDGRLVGTFATEVDGHFHLPAFLLLEKQDDAE